MMKLGWGGLDSGEIKDWAQTLALIFAGVWAVYVFIYEDRIEPAGLPPHVTMSSDMELLGGRDSLVAVKGRITVTNSSPVRVYLLASWYWLSGSEVLRHEFHDTLFAGLVLERIRADSLGPTARHWAEEGFRVIGTGKILPEKTAWLEEGESFTREFITYFLIAEYDHLRLYGGVIAAKRNDLTRIEWTVHESGFPAPVVSVKEVSLTGNGNWERFDPTNAGHQRLQEKHGILTTYAMSEHNLWSP